MSTTERDAATPSIGEIWAALHDLVWTIDKRWEGESERKRSNAISPNMEEAIAKARQILALPLSETVAPFQPDEKQRAEVAKSIDAYPLLASLLYDIDLMPEQIKDERRYNYMLAVIDHMRQALNAAPQAPAATSFLAETSGSPAGSASRCVVGESQPKEKA